jgi:RHS repeat-associated protein
LRTYTYDHANRLTQVVSGTLTTQFTYNGAGDRVAKTVDGVETRYTLDPAAGLTQVLQETTGGQTTSYLYGHDLLAQYDSGTWAYHVDDGLGSVRGLADPVGQVVQGYSFSPFGVPLGESGGAPYGFTGEQWDASAGLVFLRARYYEPEVGRFFVPDPLIGIVGDFAMPQSLNPYDYVGGDPINYVDPSGLIREGAEAGRARDLLKQLWDDYNVFIEEDFGYVPGPQPVPVPVTPCPTTNPKWEEGMWEIEELERVKEAVSDLASMMRGADRFRQNLGRVVIARRQMRYGGLGDAYSVILNANYFTKWTVVHELSHAWDGANGWRLSKELQEYVGGKWLRHPGRLPGGGAWYRYDPGTWPPPAGIDMGFNAKEDFAESVTAFVYPGKAKQAAGRDPKEGGVPYGRYGYTNYYQTPRARYVAKLLGRIRECRLWAEIW